MRTDDPNPNPAEPVPTAKNAASNVAVATSSTSDACGEPPYSCPRSCARCGQPVGGPHDWVCPWPQGSARHEFPRISPATTVESAHRHRPGCPQVVRSPGPLFTSDEAEDTNGGHDEPTCEFCGETGTEDITEIDSFGGTTEYHQRCSACGQQWSFCDMSAVL